MAQHTCRKCLCDSFGFCDGSSFVHLFVFVVHAVLFLTVELCSCTDPQYTSKIVCKNTYWFLECSTMLRYK